MTLTGFETLKITDTGLKVCMQLLHSSARNLEGHPASEIIACVTVSFLFFFFLVACHHRGNHNLCLGTEDVN